MKFENLSSVSLALLILPALLISSNCLADKWTKYGVVQCKEVTLSHSRMVLKGDGEIEPRELGHIIGWITGFATAVNSAIGSPPNYFKNMTDIDMLNWVASWCVEHPKGDLDQAMRNLAAQFRPE